mgnify:CR=1 FL=1|tara:strand:+ start:29714 stop:30289 length:576 start_codon:yes stop_codon:yes gene_type:complete
MEIKKTKLKIIKTAIKLYSQKGLNIPVKDIIDAAKISNGSFFHHFSKKERLPEEIFDLIKNELDNFVFENKKYNEVKQENFKERTHNIFDILVDWGVLEKDKFLFLLKFKNADDIYTTDKQNNVLREKVENIIEEGIITNYFNDFDKDYLVDIFISHIAHTVFYISDKKKPKLKTKKFGFITLWNSLRNYE